MGKLYLTGDIHGWTDISKLYPDKFSEGQSLTKDDFLIILGDFGLIFYPKETNYVIKEKKYLDKLNDYPWTTLFICGNHENFNRLWSDEFPVMNDFHSGKVSKIRDSIFYLHRGEIFDFNNKSFLTLGGASSIDKIYRKRGFSWWPQEEITKEEYEIAMNNLEKRDFEVDYILSHTAATDHIRDLWLKNLLIDLKKIDQSSQYLQKIKDKTKYKHWYFGHFHADCETNDYSCLYDKIVRVF